MRCASDYFKKILWRKYLARILSLFPLLQLLLSSKKLLLAPRSSVSMGIVQSSVPRLKSSTSLSDLLSSHCQRQLSTCVLSMPAAVGASLLPQSVRDARPSQDAIRKLSTDVVSRENVSVSLVHIPNMKMMSAHFTTKFVHCTAI